MAAAESKTPAKGKMPLRLAEAIASHLATGLVFATPKYQLEVMGGVRREAADVKDIDLIVVVPDDCKIDGVLASAKVKKGSPVRITSFGDCGDLKASIHVVTRGGHKAKADLFLVRRGELPFARLHYTGNKVYNIRVRAHAKKLGYKLNQHGLFSAATGRRARGSAAWTTVKQVLAFLGVSYKTPAQRNEK